MRFLRKIKGGKDPKLFVLLDQAIVSGSNFIMGILIARFLGIEQFGIFGFIYLIYLFGLGLQQAFFVIPLYSLGAGLDDFKNKTYLDSLLLLQLLSSVIFAIVCVFGIMILPFNFSDEIVPLSGLIGATSFLILVQDFIRRLFLYKRELKKLLVIDLIAYGSQILFLLLVFFTEKLELESCLAIVCSSMFLAVVFGFYKINRPQFVKKSIKDSFRTHWVYSKWLLARAILTYSSGNFFIIAAGTILGPVAIGAIKMGQNLHGVINVFFLAIENHVPIVSAKLYKHKGKSALFTYLKNTSLVSIIVCSVFGCTVVVFSNWLISTLYGSEYQVYSYVLIWFAILNLLVCIAMPFRFILRTFEKTKDLFLATLFAAVFGLLFAYPLIHNFQLYGVLIGLIGSQLIMIGWFGFSVLFREKQVALI